MILSVIIILLLRNEYRISSWFNLQSKKKIEGNIGFSEDIKELNNSSGQ